MNIGQITEAVPTVTANTTNRVVDQFFTENHRIQGVVVVENDIPIALITRTLFYQKLGSLYGYNLYMGRSISLLMDKNILAIDYMTSIFRVSELAMEREDERLYDYIIVTKLGKFYGVVSIRTLLITLANAQFKRASHLNPLTWLPGNHVINEKLQQVLQHETYTVLYIDLDQFKTYNDVYGFAKGDEVIKETASILRKYIDETAHFLGHIGGDDFLAILYHHDYQSICEKIIAAFNHSITTFYHDNHLAQGYILSENRVGQSEKIPLVSLSIAAITNEYHHFESVEEVVSKSIEVKRQCKQVDYSCYMVNATSCTN